MTEEELNEVRQLYEAILAEELRIKTMRLSARNLVSSFPDGLPRAKNLRSRVEELAVKIIVEWEIVEKQRLKFEQKAATLHQKIFASENLDAIEKAVLSLRYATCMNFSEIQTELNLTRSTTFYLHRTAKKKILKQIALD